MHEHPPYSSVLFFLHVRLRDGVNHHMQQISACDISKFGNKWNSHGVKSEKYGGRCSNPASSCHKYSSWQNPMTVFHVFKQSHIVNFKKKKTMVNTSSANRAVCNFFRTVAAVGFSTVSTVQLALVASRLRLSAGVRKRGPIFPNILIHNFQVAYEPSSFFFRCLLPQLSHARRDGNTRVWTFVILHGSTVFGTIGLRSTKLTCDP